MAVLLGALPGDHEVAVRVGRDRRVALLVGGEGVDPELGALGGAGGVEPPSVDGNVGIRGVGLPGDHEVAIGVGGDLREARVVGGRGVDLELHPHRRARGRESLAVDGVEVEGSTVLPVAHPCHDEVAVALGRHDRAALGVRCVGVDAELAAQNGPGRVEEECPDAFAAVLDRVGPDHDEVTVRVDGDGGVVLVVEREAVDLELDALANHALGEQGTTAEQTPHHREAELRSPATQHDRLLASGRIRRDDEMVGRA